MKNDTLTPFHNHARMIVSPEKGTPTHLTQGRTIGHTCSFVPEEILMALSLVPYRIRGIGAQDTTFGDTYFGPFICSMPKCLLQMACEKKYRFLDGLIITPGCDSIRRLDECWRKAGKEVDGITPGFFFHLGTPHKLEGFTVDFFADELRRLVAELESHFNTRLDEEALIDAIATCNKSRRLLNRLHNLRNEGASPVSGTDTMAILLAQGTMERPAFNKALASFLESTPDLPPKTTGKARLMLAGSATDDPTLIAEIEGDNAVVVADNLCVGMRPPEEELIPENDPIRALARHYLARCRCPRMFGDFERRKHELLKAVEDAGVQGVIFQNIRFCDLHGSENALLEKALAARGIPCMQLEREYGPLVETGRLRMRRDAFLETLTLTPTEACRES